MSDLDALLAELAGRLPLRILEVLWESGSLVVNGDGWGVTVSASWRLVEGGRLHFGSEDPAAEDWLWDLIGLDVVAVEPQSPAAPVDPAFVLSSGETLEVFSVDAVDPWVVRLPDVTVVGSPTADG